MNSNTLHLYRLTYPIVILGLFAGFIVGINTTPVQAQPVMVKVEQPNIWTLDQAHYLLAQMRRRNLDLKTPISKLGDLDPNAINGSAIDVLQNLLAISAQFDQSIGANNDITRQNNSDIRNEKQFIASQRRELLARRAQLQSSSLKITTQIAELKIRLIRAKSDDEKEKLQAQIDELTVVQDVLKEQLTQTNADLEALPANEKDFELFKIPTPAPDTSDPKLTSVLANMADQISKQIENNPQLNASVRLDNYIQLQYEIISKQLTLIRDEVGPGERLVFLELPQSINVSYDNSKNKLGQAWWKIKAYSECNTVDADGGIVPCSKSSQIVKIQKKTGSTSGDIVRKVTTLKLNDVPGYKTETLYITRDETNTPDQIEKILDIILTRKPYYVGTVQGALGIENISQLKSIQSTVLDYQKCVKEVTEGCDEKVRNFIKNRDDISNTLQAIFRGFIDGKGIQSDNPRWASVSPKVTRAFNDLLYHKDEKLYRRIIIDEIFKGAIDPWQSIVQKLIDLDNLPNKHDMTPMFGPDRYTDRTIRTVDLFPKQGSLNVNDVKVRTDQISLRAIFGFLTGFGAKANYERTRERFSQFVQQELYSSAFGKGNREFGWTFYPMPGTNRLLSGIRTTYAIAVIPEDATSLVIEGKGCFFPRSSLQPVSFDEVREPRGNRSGCSDAEVMVVPLPNGGNPYSSTFSIEKISYNSVAKGEKAILSIEGENLSPEIGIVVNGVPLSASIGLAQPFIRDDSTVGGSVATESAPRSVKGSFERINSRKIIATFEMGADFQGTPTITLISPGASEILNHNQNLEVKEGGEPFPFFNLTDAPYIFGRRFDKKSPITMVETVDAFLVDREHLRVLLKGQRFEDAAHTATVTSMFINGEVFEKCDKHKKPDKCFDIISDNLIVLSLNILPQIKTVKISLVTSLGTLDAVSVNNPAAAADVKADPILAKYAVDKTKFSFDSFTLETCTIKDKKIDAVIKITGTGLTGETKAYIGTVEQVTELEDGKLFVTMPDAKATQKVLLQEPKLKLQDERIVVLVKPKDGCIEK